MTFSEEKKSEVLTILYSQAQGNATRCALITGVDRKLILEWKKEQLQSGVTSTPLIPSCETDCNDDGDDGEIPTPADIKQRIIRRVSQLVETCTDPKKLMDTYEALTKSERETPQNKVSVFEEIERKLSEGEAGGRMGLKV